MNGISLFTRRTLWVSRVPNGLSVYLHYQAPSAWKPCSGVRYLYILISWFLRVIRELLWDQDLQEILRVVRLPLRHGEHLLLMRRLVLSHSLVICMMSIKEKRGEGEGSPSGLFAFVDVGVDVYVGNVSVQYASRGVDHPIRKLWADPNSMTKKSSLSVNATVWRQTLSPVFFLLFHLR